MKKLVFVFGHIPDPRMYRRIIALKESFEVYVVCARRINQNVFIQKEIPGVTQIVKDMELPSISQLLRRINASRDYRKFILENLNTIQPSVIYAEGLDTLMAVNKYARYRKVTVIDEVADLRECFIEDMPKSFFRRIIDSMICYKERKMFKCVDLLVLTSMKFYDVHYKYFFPKEKVFFLPNMPETSAFKSFSRKKEDDFFTIGFIGGLRYIRQMYLLVDAASKAGVNVVIAGAVADVADDFINYCKEKQHVKLLGRYNYDKDIASLYGMMDCIYSVYDADNANVRIALPNKLYESIYCCIPIIVAKNTYLSEIVEEWGVGVSVNHLDENELTNTFMKLRDDKSLYNRIIQNCSHRRNEIDINRYLHQLVETIKSL